MRFLRINIGFVIPIVLAVFDDKITFCGFFLYNVYIFKLVFNEFHKVL